MNSPEAWLAANVHLHAKQAPDGRRHVFDAGTARSAMPAWAVDAITNPKCWTDQPPAPRRRDCQFCGATVSPIPPFITVDGGPICDRCLQLRAPGTAAMTGDAREAVATAAEDRYSRDAALADAVDEFIADALGAEPTDDDDIGEPE